MRRLRNTTKNGRKAYTSGRGCNSLRGCLRHRRGSLLGPARELLKGDEAMQMAAAIGGEIVVVRWMSDLARGFALGVAYVERGGAVAGITPD